MRVHRTILPESDFSNRESDQSRSDRLQRSSRCSAGKVENRIGAGASNRPARQLGLTLMKDSDYRAAQKSS